MNVPLVQPPKPGSWMLTAAREATGTVPHHSAGKMSPSQRSRTLAAPQELLFNQLPLPQTTYSRDSHHHHHHHHPPLRRCPGAGTAAGHPDGSSEAGQESAGSRDPSGELPGAAGDAVSPQLCPAPGLDEPLGLGGGCRAEPSPGCWEGTWSESKGVPSPSTAELEEAVDLLQDVGEALVFGGAGGQGALRRGCSPVN